MRENVAAMLGCLCLFAVCVVARFITNKIFIKNDKISNKKIVLLGTIDAVLLGLIFLLINYLKVFDEFWVNHFIIGIILSIICTILLEISIKVIIIKYFLDIPGKKSLILSVESSFVIICSSLVVSCILRVTSYINFEVFLLSLLVISVLISIKDKILKKGQITNKRLIIVGVILAILISIIYNFFF